MRMILDTAIVAAMLLSSVPGLVETLPPSAAQTDSAGALSELLTSLDDPDSYPLD